MTGARQLYNIDEDDALDERGIVRDGQVIHRSLQMMDSVQRAVMANHAHAFGLDDAPALGRRYEDAADNHGFDIQRNTSEREQVYADAEQRLTNAWRDPANAFREEDEPLRPDEIITPWRGRFSAAAPLPTNDEQKPPATLEASYQSYFDYLKDAWRNPPAMAPIVPDSAPQSLLPPPSTALTDERERLYAKRNEAYENAWKNPL